MMSCAGSNDQFSGSSKVDKDQWMRAEKNSILFNDGIRRCESFVQGWLNHADPLSTLIPRNLDRDSTIWNAKDAAADNYPFMVLTAALTDSTLFNGRMMDMLNNEIKLTSRIGNLPDTYDFVKGGFASEEADLSNIIFGASEYVKDGLLPLTEWLGESPWSDRMLAILDDIWENASVKTSYGNIPSTNVEVNGEMLQVLSRLYWMTGKGEYLEWATRLGDYYLLGDRHPTLHSKSLRLRDHGCEIVSGLCELYATMHFKNSAKKHEYQPLIHTMLDRILEVGRNDDGLFFDVVDPQTGKIINNRVADNFGYNLNGFYTVFLLDSVDRYLDATIKALRTLNANYRNFEWEGQSSDGYADAIEGALNLFNRESISSVASWLDSETQVMWGKQQGDGVIEGWHGDGNFARTTIMYCLWKSKGVTVFPWREDLQIGGEVRGDTLWITITVEKPWRGKIIFDKARHREILNLPLDWPRINQFPEWYVVQRDSFYRVISTATDGKTVAGDKLISGLEVDLPPGSHYYKVFPNSDGG